MSSSKNRQPAKNRNKEVAITMVQCMFERQARLDKLTKAREFYGSKREAK